MSVFPTVPWAKRDFLSVRGLHVVTPAGLGPYLSITKTKSPIACPPTPQAHNLPLTSVLAHYYLLWLCHILPYVSLLCSSYLASVRPVRSCTAQPSVYTLRTLTRANTCALCACPSTSFLLCPHTWKSGLQTGVCVSPGALHDDPLECREKYVWTSVF